MAVAVLAVLATTVVWLLGADERAGRELTIDDHVRAAHQMTRPSDGTTLYDWVTARVRRVCPGIENDEAEWEQKVGSAGVSAGIILLPTSRAACGDELVGKTVWFAHVVRDGSTLAVVAPDPGLLPDGVGASIGVEWWQDFVDGDAP